MITKICTVCGKEYQVKPYRASTSKYCSMACASKGYIKDLNGLQFGRWKVIGFDKMNGRYAHWVCQCECGTIKSIRGSHLLEGTTTSCGCYQKELCADRMREKAKHNQSNTKLYNAYIYMKERCYYKKGKNYKNYGGRGIKVCDEWLGENGFLNFYKWAIENGYKKETLDNGVNKWTLDRIDVNGNYEPSNCRWATAKEQANNTRRNRIIEHNGKRQNITQWSTELSISRSSLMWRLNNGWSIDKAFSTPVREFGKGV